ncbi:sensor histidine kinase [Brevundimonas aurantiaca]|uniref:sensor histidine kinase n=1 Tax=Brevundimonas aurantiaca TaxID=74316 RepID=UPI001D18AF60|nr:ATP-binding protein [Brevundimonas aurantiaca]MCC4294483.1 PAS domain S-box protein [Brevundimonas aurantiaca]
MEDSLASSVFVGAPMAIVAVDRTGRVRNHNPAAQQLFGAVLDDPSLSIDALFEGFNLDDVATPEAAQAFNGRRDPSGQAPIWQARRADGEDAFVEIQATRFTHKTCDCATLFIQDVSARVAAETAVQDLRLQIMYNWRLNSLGEVASMAAHDLSQPLSAAANFLEAARRMAEARPEAADDLPQALIAAKGQIDRASAIIRRLRQMMRHESGPRVRENVSEVVKEILPILRMHVGGTRADIQVRLDPADTAWCDRVQIQQVLINLIRNALDAPENGKRRRIEITGGPVDGGYQLSVADNGPGVAPDMAGKLFEPLASSKPGGMGLGLSICRTLVEAHGGTLALTPSPLGGAAFAFNLADETLTEAPRPAESNRSDDLLLLARASSGGAAVVSRAPIGPGAVFSRLN